MSYIMGVKDVSRFIEIRDHEIYQKQVQVTLFHDM